MTCDPLVRMDRSHRPFDRPEMSNLVSRLSLGRLVRVGVAVGMGQGTAIAEAEPGREGNVTRV